MPEPAFQIGKLRLREGRLLVQGLSEVPAAHLTLQLKSAHLCPVLLPVCPGHSKIDPRARSTGIAPEILTNAASQPSPGPLDQDLQTPRHSRWAFGSPSGLQLLPCHLPVPMAFPLTPPPPQMLFLPQTLSFLLAFQPLSPQVSSNLPGATCSVSSSSPTPGCWSGLLSRCTLSPGILIPLPGFSPQQVCAHKPR